MLLVAFKSTAVFSFEEIFFKALWLQQNSRALTKALAFIGMRFKGENDWEGNRYLVNILLSNISHCVGKHVLIILKWSNIWNMHIIIPSECVFSNQIGFGEAPNDAIVTDLKGPHLRRGDFLGRISHDVLEVGCRGYKKWFSERYNCPESAAKRNDAQWTCEYSTFQPWQPHSPIDDLKFEICFFRQRGWFIDSWWFWGSSLKISWEFHKFPNSRNWSFLWFARLQTGWRCHLFFRATLKYSWYSLKLKTIVYETRFFQAFLQHSRKCSMNVPRQGYVVAADDANTLHLFRIEDSVSCSPIVVFCENRGVRKCRKIVEYVWNSEMHVKCYFCKRLREHGSWVYCGFQFP